jgi:hypothetical protein
MPVFRLNKEDTMSQLLPVGFSLGDLIRRVLGADKGAVGEQQVVDLSSSAELLMNIQEGKIAIPKTLGELNEHKIFTNTVEAKVALDLGIPLVGGFKADGSTSVFVQDYANYCEVVFGQTTLIMGVTIRYKIAFRVLDASAQVQNLPCITASAQLGFVQAEAQFEVRGVTSYDIAQAIPVITKLDVEAYTTYSDALKTIKKLMWEKDAIFSPVPIIIRR